MSKHTPGPWHDWNDPVCSVMGARQEGDGGLKAVAIVAQWPSEEERAANARLIAAAPDMLKALESLDEWLGAVPVGVVPGGLAHGKIRAAIAKAKGTNA